MDGALSTPWGANDCTGIPWPHISAQLPLSLADRSPLYLLLRVLPSLSFSSPSVISLLALENQELTVKASHKMLQTTASFVLSSMFFSPREENQLQTSLTLQEITVTYTLSVLPYC